MLNYPSVDKAMAAVHKNYVPDEKQDLYQQGADVLFDLTTGLPLFVHRPTSRSSRMDARQLVEHVPTVTDDKIEEARFV